MNSISIGRNGEAAVAAELCKQGYDIFMPIFGNADCDMIALKDGVSYRVEVKSGSQVAPNGSYRIPLKSIRHNTTSTYVNKFNASRCDILAVYIVPEDRVVFLDPTLSDGKTLVTVK